MKDKLTPTTQKLNSKQELFCNEYLVDLCGTKAAIRAGYSNNTSAATASRLLTYVNISQRIKELIHERNLRTGLSADLVLTELAYLGSVCLRDGFDIDKGTLKPSGERSEGFERSIKKIKVSRKIRMSMKDGEPEPEMIETVELEMYDKKGVLESLGKHFGLFPTKIEAKIEVEDPVKVAELKAMFESMTQIERDEWLDKYDSF